VAVVCFVMAMHNGFESELRDRLLGTTSHISIFANNGDFIYDYGELTEEIEQLEHVVAASPFIYYKAAISTEDKGDGIVVRGIDLELENKTASVAENIKYGEYNFDLSLTDTAKSETGILVGTTLASRLGVDLGDPIVMYSLRGENLRRSARPRMAKFYVTGIFETGVYEFDSEMAYISLTAAQDLFKMTACLLSIIAGKHTQIILTILEPVTNSIFNSLNTIEMKICQMKDLVAVKGLWQIREIQNHAGQNNLLGIFVAPVI